MLITCKKCGQILYYGTKRDFRKSNLNCQCDSYITGLKEKKSIYSGI